MVLEDLARAIREIKIYKYKKNMSNDPILYRVFMLLYSIFYMVRVFTGFY